MPRINLFNLRSDLSATALTFGGQALIRLISSTILTRILQPEAYGLIAIVMSIVTVVEMLGDIGVTMFVIRDRHGDDPNYLNTAWTLRIVRALLNAAIVFFFAPLISSALYDVPGLATPLRLMSLYFLFGGMESMSFAVAIRRKRSLILMYSELVSLAVSTTFTLSYCYYFRDYWGVLYGMLIGRLLLTTTSYFIYPEMKRRLLLDRGAVREMLGFTKYVMPSTILTLALTQFDKMVFLRLFNLPLLGVYGLGGNIAQPIESLVIRISQMVLFPRCAHNFRDNQESYALKYYTENKNVFVFMLVLPAAIGGAAGLVVGVLYDSRYAQAASVLQAFMLRAALRSLAMPSEDMLFAAGETRLFLMGELLRAIWVFGGSLIGAYFFGFLGFCYGIALSGLPPLAYFLWLQNRRGFLIGKYEVYKVAFMGSVAILAYLGSGPALLLWRTLRTSLI